MQRLLVTFLGLILLTIHAEYLGNLSANLFDPNLIAGPYATEGLQLNDQQGNYQGKLSTNPYDPDSVSNPYDRYGVLIHQSHSIVCTAQDIPIDWTAPSIRMPQTGASRAIARQYRVEGGRFQWTRSTASDGKSAAI